MAKNPKFIQFFGNRYLVLRHYPSAVCNEAEASQLRFQIAEQRPGAETYCQLKFGQTIYDVNVVFNGCFYFKLKPNATDYYYCYRPYHFTPSSDKTEQQLDQLDQLDDYIQRLTKERGQMVKALKRRTVGLPVERSKRPSKLKAKPKPKKRRPAHR